MLGSSFGGNVALTYAALFPLFPRPPWRRHPGGVILANTNGHRGEQRVMEAFGRPGSPAAAAVIQHLV